MSTCLGRVAWQGWWPWALCRRPRLLRAPQERAQPRGPPVPCSLLPIPEPSRGTQQSGTKTSLLFGFSPKALKLFPCHV